ncbi:hypothetical protein LJR074_001928 [Acidovorax sp. LjRoot74]|uniref:hypothetical protein n=1 Tax=Acidovorax sp. LjRoot74 TaxID=3342337 RepID=UPI003ED02171
MTNTTKHDALLIADEIEAAADFPAYPRAPYKAAAALLRSQHAHIVDMDAQLAAIGAGGVGGPLMGAALTAAPAAVPALNLTKAHIDYVARYGGKCRDCADENGVCPGSGLPCGGARKAIQFVFDALTYGVTHGYITSPFVASHGQAFGGPCDKAPSGWLCTRAHGHDGPCAATPTLSERSDDWVAGYAAGVNDGRADALRASHGQAPAQPEVADECKRCSGSGEDPEGYFDKSRGPDGDTLDGPCRECDGTGLTHSPQAAQQAPAGAAPDPWREHLAEQADVIDCKALQRAMVKHGISFPEGGMEHFRASLGEMVNRFVRHADPAAQVDSGVQEDAARTGGAA